MIKVGLRVPNATLLEFSESESDGCSLGPKAFSVSELVKDKKIVVFGLPGAFTPTCSGRHLPGFVNQYEKLRAAGIDEVWCHAVNDAFVMGAWGREHKSEGKVRMMADGVAQWARAMGLDQDLSERGLGVRAKRYAMTLENGVVTNLFVEAPGKFEISSVESILDTLRGNSH